MNDVHVFNTNSQSTLKYSATASGPTVYKSKWARPQQTPVHVIVQLFSGLGGIGGIL